MGIYSMGRLLLIILTDKCITDKCIIGVIWVLCWYIKKTCNGPKSLFAIIQVQLFFSCCIIILLDKHKLLWNIFSKDSNIIFIQPQPHNLYNKHVYTSHSVTSFLSTNNKRSPFLS